MRIAIPLFCLVVGAMLFYISALLLQNGCQPVWCFVITLLVGLIVAMWAMGEVIHELPG